MRLLLRPVHNCGYPWSSDTPRFAKSMLMPPNRTKSKTQMRIIESLLLLLANTDGWIRGEMARSLVALGPARPFTNHAKILPINKIYCCPLFPSGRLKGWASGGHLARSMVRFVVWEQTGKAFLTSS